MTTKSSKKSKIVSWQKNLWIIFFAQVTTMIGFSSIFPFLPLYIESIGKVSSIKIEILMGLVYSGQAFTMMIASPIWGNLADRFGRKLMVVRAMLGGSVILTLMAFVRSAEELVFLRAVQGLITGTVGSANALVASYDTKKHIGYAMGVLQMGIGIGIAIGPLIGGMMADLFGYRSAFYVTGGMLLISGFTVLFGVKEEFKKPGKKERSQISFISGWHNVLVAKGVLITFCLRFTNQMGRMIFIPILPLFVATLIDQGTKVNSFTGLIIGVTSATMTTSSIYLGRLGDRIGHRHIVIGASLFCGLFLAFQAFVTTGWQLLIFHAIFGIGLGGIVPGVSALLSTYTKIGEEGVVYGLDNSISSGARMIAPLLGVSIAMWFGFRSVFAIAGLLYLIAAILAIVKLPKRSEINRD